jgi:hypothetical protein
MKIWVVTWYDGAAEFEVKGAYRSRAAAVASIHTWCNEIFSEEAGFAAEDRAERHAEIDKLATCADSSAEFGPSAGTGTMIEFILIIALIVLAHRLRRAARTPQRPVEVHIYHHLVPGPGESQPLSERSNVIELRSRKIRQAA